MRYLNKKIMWLAAVAIVLFLDGIAGAAPATITGDVDILWNKSVSGWTDADLMSDIDGDNKADALITDQTCSGTCTYTVTAVRGYDGAELWSKSYSNWIQVTSAGDIDGDNKDDALITNTTCSGTCTYTVTAVRGYDGVELWNKTSSGWNPAASAGDLNGDNKADVIITTQICSGTCTYTVTAVRGYDGVELWNRTSSNWMQAVPVGDLNGDNKADVVITSQIYTGTWIYTTTAVRGYDGSEMWNRTSSNWMQAVPVGDLNGDNKADAIITTYNSGTYTATAVRGYDGSEMWNKTSSNWMQSVPVGDLNGDNKADAIITTYNSGTYTATAVRGYDGSEMWNKTISGSSGWMQAASAGDINNDLKWDVIINFNDWSSSNYTISYVSGIDGSEFFGVKANSWLGFSNLSYPLKRYDLNGNGGDDILVWTYDNLYALSAQPYQGSSIGYSALVATGQNTFVQSSNGTFGLLLKGQTKTINNSVLLNNTGDISAKVEARFNDSVAGVYGLISGANVLNATNFALGLPSAPMPLSSIGADVQVAIAAPGVTAMDARLGVPSDAVAGDYTGTVILTFSNNV